MSYLAELRAGDTRLGGKAGSLSRLASAGLPTPAGFVVTDDLFRALCPEFPAYERLDEEALVLLDRLRKGIRRAPWPADFLDELRGRLAMLPATSFAVRSSFASEDRPGRLAAGVYDSRVDVSISSVEQAIRDVLCSALAPGAVAYAVSHGEVPGDGPFAVLVHEYVAGTAEGSAALVPVSAATPAEPLVTLRRGELPAEARANLGAAIAGLAATAGPIEVEWVLARGQVVYLQTRPYEAPRAPSTWAGWTGLVDESMRDRWQWDAGHNPLPLSPAQAGLVEIVDGSCSIGVRQRVLGGYLFCARDEHPLPPAIRCEDAEAFFASLRLTVETRLTELGPRPNLEEALRAFVFAYQQIFGVLQPALREAQVRLRGFLEAHAPAALELLPLLRAAVPSVASERLAAAGRVASAGTGEARDRAIADYLVRFGDEAGSWDVVAPTLAEDPRALRDRPAEAAVASADWQRASAEVEVRLDARFPVLRHEWRKLLSLARTAVALGEADDWLYARLQASVRRALLVLGERLAAERVLAEIAEIFYLPLSHVRSIAGGAVAPPGLAALAAEGRRAWQEACRDPPPSRAACEDGAVWGTGTGGRAIGRVFLHRPGSRSSEAGVLVTRTLLPTELPLLAPAAIVSETGGPLDHVAAQARERGIPAVVGASGALAALREGDWVLVDGERGLVVRLG